MPSIPRRTRTSLKAGKKAPLNHLHHQKRQNSRTAKKLFVAKSQIFEAPPDHDYMQTREDPTAEPAEKVALHQYICQLQADNDSLRKRVLSLDTVKRV